MAAERNAEAAPGRIHFDLTTLRLFIATAELGGVTKAAERVHLAPRGHALARQASVDMVDILACDANRVLRLPIEGAWATRRFVLCHLPAGSLPSAAQSVVPVLLESQSANPA